LIDFTQVSFVGTSLVRVVPEKSELNAIATPLLKINMQCLLDILAAVKRTAIPKPHDLGFCFFPEGFFAPATPVLLCSGLMVALQTDTASPAAKIFLLALISRSWCVPQIGQSHSRTFNGIFKGNMPTITTPLRTRKPSIYFDVRDFQRIKYPTKK
jgi:hypothetical protein